MGLQYNMTDAKDRPRLADVANKTAKKTLKKQTTNSPDEKPRQLLYETVQ